MGGSRAQKNKPHKTRFSSKSSRNLHKENKEKRPLINGSRNNQIPIAQKARTARLNHNKNAFIAVSSRSNVKTAKAMLVEQINTSVSSFGSGMDIEYTNSGEVLIENHLCHRHKLRLTVIETNYGDLEGCLMAAKVADAIAFVTAATSEKDHLIDTDGKLCLSMLRAQGLPTVFGLIQDLVDVPIKKRSDIKKASSSIFGGELPEGSKIFFADRAEDLEQVLRFLSNHRFMNPQWRSTRPYVYAQKVEFEPMVQESECGTLLLSGYVRGRALSVNQLVHLTGVGDYQVKQIDILEDPSPFRRDHKGMNEAPMDSEKVDTLHPDPAFQEPLIVENVPDPLAGEQTWPTEEELAKAEEKQKKFKKRLLPKGTSEYQAAWIVDENNDDEDYGEERADDKMEDMDSLMPGAEEEDGVLSEDQNARCEDLVLDEEASTSGESDNQSEMMVEEGLTAESMQAELERLKAAHAADAEFPDEIDTPMDVPARQRFMKYRGLKSLRTSAWDAKESLPQEYSRVFSFENFTRTQKTVFTRAAEVDAGQFKGSVCLGAYVKVHISGISAISAMKLLKNYTQVPVIACGLLQHESKMSVLHFSIKKHESFSEPIRSKDPLIFHAGFRIFKTRPIFSTDDINMDKHKLERFLQPGRFSVASVFAPICFPPIPLVVFKDVGIGELALAASGSLKSVDPDRIILKKIVLSGYPLRVQKQRAVVRFMFHNPEDVRWFKPLELWTKYGRRGRIKEPVGTHGAMKCIFDGVLQQRDAVCVSLYKRVYPKWPELTS
ncbi:hypothetical protein KP509_23G085500 [Ceratopteris richardii]|uniref:Bms1-type G domain-containing protein n=1 Tax=Ceratopteris richardii TaxID=49495 RepID=A0A8T2S1W0_CERRI|nr:hypothetical protein KP509_23G085500 [Ceratopteris richardii]KAH7302741.1 hypothetical protein KP509_23G085500 [Ceratopteris richardii]KAH7302745.1 hypothetical protein KP509_23G085500 [Ceratopteris richardii]KAH7302749.1 hypothetical protein KP509_23G085500 [Ceratopteris richardii]